MPPKTETYRPIDAAVADVVKTIRSETETADINPSERREFQDLLADRLTALADKLRSLSRTLPAPVRKKDVTPQDARTSRAAPHLSRASSGPEAPPRVAQKPYFNLDCKFMILSERKQLGSACPESHVYGQ